MFFKNETVKCEASNFIIYMKDQVKKRVLKKKFDFLIINILLFKRSSHQVITFIVSG